MLIHEYIAGCAQTPFQWGKYDCCTFAATAAKIVTNGKIDALKGLKWGSPIEALLEMERAFNTRDLSVIFGVIIERYDLEVCAPGTNCSCFVTIPNKGVIINNRYTPRSSLGFSYMNSNFIPGSRGLINVPTENIMKACLLPRTE